MIATPDFLPQRRLFEVRLEDLSDLELLALILSPGKSSDEAFRLAGRLMQRAGSAVGLCEATGLQLQEWGLGRRRAAALLAAATLFRRLRPVALEPRQPFRSSVEIFRHFEPLLRGLKKECFWSVLLDGKNRITRLVRISEGSLTASLAHPREVFRPAVREAAAAVLFVHNHPSGDPEPSPEDIQITRRLVESGRILGIRVLDHVIIGGRSYYSFADQGMLSG